MKNHLLTICLALLSFGAQAQEPATGTTPQAPAAAPSRPMPSQATPQMMAKELGLTDKQVEELNSVDREHQDRIRELQRAGLDQQAKRARTIELRDRKQAEIRKVMTAEQWAQWQQMKQSQRDASLKQHQERKQLAPHQE